MESTSSLADVSAPVVVNEKLPRLVQAALVELGSGWIAEHLRTGARPSEDWRWKTAATMAMRTLTAAEDVPLDRDAVATLLCSAFGGVLFQITWAAIQQEATMSAYAAELAKATAELRARDERIDGLELQVELLGRRN
jgi:hypothetical protein